jgi:hypothetical protein
MIAQAIIDQLASQYQRMPEAALVALATFEIWQVITMIASGMATLVFSLVMTVA